MLAERAALWLIGMLTGIVIAVMLGLGPQAPDPTLYNTPALDTRAVHVEEDGSIAGWGCLQGYPCDDTAHAEP